MSNKKLTQSEIDYILTKDDIAITDKVLLIVSPFECLELEFCVKSNGYYIYQTSGAYLDELLNDYITDMRGHRYLFDAGDKSELDTSIFNDISEFIVRKKPELAFSLPIDITQVPYELTSVYVFENND